MKINPVCKILGHDLFATPPEYTPEAIVDTIGGGKLRKPAQKIHDGHILCKRNGCEFQEDVWRVERVNEEIKHAKFSKTFWRSETWNSIRNILSIAFWTIFGLAIVCIVVYFLVVFPEEKTCATLSTKFGLETVWNFWTGCMVHSEKFGWVPSDQFFQIINLNVP